MPVRPAIRNTAIRVTLDALYFSAAFRILRGRCAGNGVVLTLHRVRPARADPFQPNGALEITPAFLESIVEVLRRDGAEFISLDELDRRFQDGDLGRRFVCLTFDDGYRDNLEWAYPILRRHCVPFAIFVTSDFADQRGHLWWLTLEAAIAANRHVSISVAGKRQTIDCGTVAAKRAAIHAIHGALLELPSEEQVRATVDRLAEDIGLDTAACCAAECMSWEELARLAADPLVTIGAHAVTHPRLRKLTAAAARHEMQASADRIERMLGRRPAHFAYPFGDAGAADTREFACAAELGFRTAFTTRPGVISMADGRRLTALPRISVNGCYQRIRHIQVLESGVATASYEGLRRLKARHRTGESAS